MLNIPKLRFKEFEGEWLKEELKNIFEISSKKFNPKKTLENMKCIELEHLSQETGEILGYTDSIKQESTKNKFDKGQVLFGKLRPYLKKFWITNFEGVCSSEIWVLNGLKISNNYLFQMIQTNKFNQIANISSGSKMPRADWKYMAEIPFFYPSNKSEQQKIATFLSTIDQKIEQLTKKKTLLESYKKGVMQKIFSQEIRFKRDDGGEFEDWEEKRFKDVGEIIGGGTPETTKSEYWNGNIQWFTPTEIKSKYIELSKRTITELGLQKSSAKLLPIGTLLFTSRATVGDVGIARNECCTNQGFQSIVVNSKNNNEFIYYWILNNRKEFLRRSSGSTFIEISKHEIKKISIKLPKKEEQQKIANFLTSLDQKITQTTQQIEAMKRFKKGLLQGMFV